jgi:hypothetical protein
MVTGVARGCAAPTAFSSPLGGGRSIGRGAPRWALNNSYNSGSSSRMEVPDLGARLDETLMKG